MRGAETASKPPPEAGSAIRCSWRCTHKPDSFRPEMGRDYMGDDWPPDEIKIILEGQHSAGLIVTEGEAMTYRVVYERMKKQ